MNIHVVEWVVIQTIRECSDECIDVSKVTLDDTGKMAKTLLKRLEVLGRFGKNMNIHAVEWIVIQTMRECGSGYLADSKTTLSETNHVSRRLLKEMQGFGTTSR